MEKQLRFAERRISYSPGKGEMIPSRKNESCDKACKPYSFPVEISGEFFWKSIKGAVLVFVFFTFIVSFYSVFTSQSQWRYIDCIEFSNPCGQSNRSEEFADNFSRDPKTNISHILFGIGGSLDTWKNRRQYSELWWEPNVTRGFVWLDQKPVNDTWPDNSPPYRVSEDTARFMGGTRSAIRISRILTEGYRLGLENVRWFVMGDDDTVFFTENLVAVLSRYDHNQFYYIGGSSESVEQDVMHSYGMAFGGGGFAVSFPLAEALSRVFDRCLDRYENFYGSDQRVQACMSEIGVPLTREPGFHQIDVRGDTYGLLSSHPISPLVSLHHLDYVKPLFPTGTQLDSLSSLVSASKADPGRVLQQSFCYDTHRNWSVSVSWGYTVQIYPELLTPNVLETSLQTFQTWRSLQNEPFTFNTRPLPPDPCAQPVIFFLDKVKEGKNETASSYRRLVVEPGKNPCSSPNYPPLKLDTVRVRSTKMVMDNWRKAPRRQCCEVVYSGHKYFQVRVRSCSHWETITPP